MYRFCDNEELKEELYTLTFKVRTLTFGERFAKLRVTDLPNESNLKSVDKEKANFFRCMKKKKKQTINNINTI